MGSRWLSVVVDARDPARLARWWAAVLGYQLLFEEPAQVGIAQDEKTSPGLVFVPVAEPRAAKNRLHVDLVPDDQAAEIERLVDMGARHVDVGQPAGAGWVVLADPEGNEFCVLQARKLAD
jgi:catechol 2,3-dioxygenase-like lactoylglutathione lyase family enzyme